MSVPGSASPLFLATAASAAAAAHQIDRSLRFEQADDAAKATFRQATEKLDFFW